MGMPASKQRRWTRTEVVRLIEQSPLHTPRYELVDAELLVTPSPSGLHQIRVVELICVLALYVAASRFGQVLTSPSDTELEPETLVQPDVSVVPVAEARRLRHAEVARDVLEWHPAGAATPLTLDLPAFFARVHGES
jgi:Uma2 family endonuclease